MTATATVQDDWVVAEIGRVLWTHALDPTLIAAVLGLTPEDAARLVAGEPAAALPDEEHRDRAALLLNILVRVELRCGHDPVAIRAALTRPVGALGGATIADRLHAGPGLATLRLIREAAGSMPVPKVRMWRVADRYS